MLQRVGGRDQAVQRIVDRFGFVSQWIDDRDQIACKIIALVGSEAIGVLFGPRAIEGVVSPSQTLNQ